MATSSAPAGSESEEVPPYQGSTFVVNNFTIRRKAGGGVCSPPLKADGLTWRLRVWPDGFRDAKGRYLSVFLELTDGPPGKSRYQYQIELVHPLNSRKNHVWEETLDFRVGEFWGTYPFFPLDDLFNQRYLDEDSLTLSAPAGDKDSGEAPLIFGDDDTPDALSSQQGDKEGGSGRAGGEAAPDVGADLTLANLADVEKCLSPDQAVSLLFLVVDHRPADYVLDRCLERLNNPETNPFSSWAEEQPDTWRQKLLEGLAVMELNDVLDNLGMEQQSRARLTEGKHLSPIRLLLYKICCYVREEKVLRKLAEYMNRSRVSRDSQPVIPQGETLPLLMELYILYWLQMDAVKWDNMSALAAGLGDIGLDVLGGLLPVSALQIGPSATSAPAAANPTTPSPYRNGGGICIIFSQEKFKCDKPDCSLIDEETKEHVPRHGCDRDYSRIESLFKGFGCDVEPIKDKTRSDINDQLKELASKAQKYDYLVVCVMSHGTIDKTGKFCMLTSDCEELEVDLVISAFNQRRAGRLQMFLLQLCRGRDALKPTSASFCHDSPPTRRQFMYSSQLSDRLICYATPPGYVSYRHSEDGSLFIQSLCDVLEEKGDRCDIETCITETHGKVTSWLIKKKQVDDMQLSMQQPQMVSTLNRSFTFKRK